jgi:DNA-binding beta-propeller fold protein YncE
MPLNGDPISREDYLKLREWIAAGAPNIDGEVKFASTTNKIYILNQGCDLLGVMDAESKLLMRYVNVGLIDGFTESPHMMKISPDGQFMYMIFLAQNPNIEVYRTSDQSFVKRIPITDGDWNTINLSPDGKYAFCVAYNARKVAVANLETNASEVFTFSKSTHGAAINGAFNRVYVTQQDESALYRLDFTDPFSPDNVEEIDLVQGTPPASGGFLKPHEVAFTPDGSKFLVTCQGVAEVRVYDAATEALLAVIPVGQDPVEFAFSAEDHLAFVTCMNDETTWGGDPNKVGSVAVINYLTNTLVTTLYSGFQPHGISIDAEHRLAYVANRNVNVGGPAPHHSSECGGRNGYLTAIDLNTLTVLPWKAEMSVDPYGVMVKP